MAKNKMKESINALTPETLYDKYKDQLTNEQFMFVNLIVIQNVKPEDALLLAYPKSAKWTQVTRSARAYNLLRKYNNPYVHEYYEELLKLIQDEYKDQLQWTKQRAQQELISIVDEVNEESRPIITKEGDIIKPRISKPRMDAKIQAIQELNKITGITNDGKLNLTVPVIFSGEDKLEDTPVEEKKDGEGNETDN